MYVLVDFEWIQRGEHIKPTQLAAIRVDENWNTISEFSGIFMHKKISSSDWAHIAYTGVSATDVENGEDKKTLIRRFYRWIKDDDILLFWHYETKHVFIKQFEEIVQELKKLRMYHLRVTLKESYGISTPNPYITATELNLDVDFIQCHNSVYDLLITQKTLKIIAPNQSVLSENLEKYKEITLIKPKKNPDPHPLPRTGYVYNTKTKELHRSSCSKAIIDDHTKKYKFKHISHLITIKCNLCDCCKKEYLLNTRKYNEKILNNPQYNYFFGKYNNAFHTKDCHHAHSLRNIVGVGNYETAINYGKVPCKICNPINSTPVKSSNAKPNPTVKKKAKNKSNKIIKNEPQNPKTPSIYSLKPMSRAIILQERAKEDRRRMMNAENLSNQQKKDIITLTKTSYAFWAGKGFQTFHRKGCIKIKSLSEIQGFSTYEEAIRMGYKPCKQCKPSQKYNVTLSIPIDSKINENECMEDAIRLCKERNLSYSIEDEKIIHIETITGKWKLYSTSSPYRLEHLNIAWSPDETEYHEQHVAFLSITEAIKYIIKHDNRLEHEGHNGKLKKKNVIDLNSQL